MNTQLSENQLSASLVLGSDTRRRALLDISDIRSVKDRATIKYLLPHAPRSDESF